MQDEQLLVGRYSRQLPATQTSLAAQGWSHAPQCSGLVWRSTHAPPHIIVPLGQEPTHMEPMHRALQTTLQSPHMPPGCEKVPGRHWQAPPVQSCEAEQAAQVAPQCSGSEETRAHCWPHICEPGAVQLH